MAARLVRVLLGTTLVVCPVFASAAKPNPPPEARTIGARERKAALLQWYRQDFPISITGGFAFDGTNLWVVTSSPPRLVRVSPIDGELLGAVSLTGAVGLTGPAFDGANMWTAYSVTANQLGPIYVAKFRPTDGAVLATYSFPGLNRYPQAVVFDGSSIWVSVLGEQMIDHHIAKFRVSDGALLAESVVRGDGRGGAMLFDGTSVWLLDASDQVSGLYKLGSDGSIVQTIDTNMNMWGQNIAFDGSSIWVTRPSNTYPTSIRPDAVLKIRASDGALLGTYATGSVPLAVAFDGTHVWVSNYYDNTVTKLRPSDGAVVDVLPTASGPGSLVYDGTSMWIGCMGALTKY